MAVTESQVVALELERVIPKVRTLFERDARFYAAVEKKDVEKVSNRQMRVPLEMNAGGAFGYFDPDGGDLGRGGGPAWDKAVVSCVFMAEAIEYTKLTEWATDSDRKAITSAVRRLTATALDETKRQLDSQCMGTGNGVVGVISAVSATATYDEYTLGTDGFGARLVRQGQTVQVFDTTLATNRGNGVITFWDVENKIIRVAPAISGSTATDKLVVNGITTPTSLPALLGVPYHNSNASSGTWLGFDRATYPQVRASRVNGSSAALTLPLPRLAVNKIGNRVGIDNTFKPQAWTHPAQAQAYEEIGQLMSVIHKAPKEEALNVFFNDNMQLAGAPLKTSFSWDKTRIDFIDPSILGWGEILPLGFYTTDGRKIFEIRGASGGVATAEIFYMVVGRQMFANNPAALAYIDALAVPSGY